MNGWVFSLRAQSQRRIRKKRKTIAEARHRHNVVIKNGITFSCDESRSLQTKSKPVHEQYNEGFTSILYIYSILEQSEFFSTEVRILF